MEIIPVLDLLGEVVVRGVGGRRDEYRPIQSLLTTNSAPSAVLDAFHDRFSARTVYAADLGGIMRGKPNPATIAELARRPVELIVDAGVKSAQEARSLFRAGAARVVAASESLPGSSVLNDLIDVFSTERIVFSMDMQRGVPIVAADEWNGEDPLDVVMNAAAIGASQFVLLDLADVGEGGGVRTLPLLAKTRKHLPNAWLAVGGGVRNMDDVIAAHEAGADAVLVASALHDGRITGDWKPPQRPMEKTAP